MVKLVAKRLTVVLREILTKHLPAPLVCLRTAYDFVQREVKDINSHLTGCCSANFLLKENTVITANAGDCRIIVVGDSGVRQLTVDHNINDNMEERARVRKCGSKYDGQAYMQYGGFGLQLTRSIGDEHFRSGGLTHEPYVKNHRLKKTDRFLIAASDGLFQNCSNTVAGYIATGKKTARAVANDLKEHVVAHGGGDNLTIIVVKL